MVTVKYVVLIMRADNDGEGGVLALAAWRIARRASARRIKMHHRHRRDTGPGAFLRRRHADARDLRAVGGGRLGVGSRTFEPLIMPLTLDHSGRPVRDAKPRHGQDRPVVRPGDGGVVYDARGARACLAIVQTPAILWALNPWYAVALFVHAPWIAFVALGSVVLAVTGCEALYADMGHFGKQPIRMAWLYLVLPALLLNYFGQGAAILHDPHMAGDRVLSPWCRIGRIIRWCCCATIATIIASQAVISGVFSITRQAVQLGQLPRMEIRHTSATDVRPDLCAAHEHLSLRRRRADRADLQELRRRWLRLTASR